MGTNFYLHFKNGNPTLHIGKRSAAGLYCWDCRQTLHKGGVDHVHGYCSVMQCSCPDNHPFRGPNDDDPQPYRPAVWSRYWQKEIKLDHFDEAQLERSTGWFECCPNCGKTRQDDSLSSSSAGKELGFQRGPLSKNGVGSCCSFSWAMFPYQLREHLKGDAGTEIRDEYDRPYTDAEFWQELEDCPIQGFDFIGVEFS